MELGRGYRSKMNKHHLHGGRISLNSDTVFVIKIPDARFIRIVSRSVFLAMALATLPFLGSILKGFSPSLGSVDSGFDATASGNINAEVLNSILHDLGEEDLLKKEDKALIVSPPHGVGQHLVKSEAKRFIMRWKEELICKKISDTWRLLEIKPKKYNGPP